MESFKTDTKARLKLLQNLPLFSHVPEPTLTALTTLFVDVSFEPDQAVVMQHEVIDSVFIIVSGEAEVSIETSTQTSDVLAVLHPGEAIGLNDTGFFSDTGTRVATVKALTLLQTIRLSIEDFKLFISRHPDLHAELLKAADYIMRLQFLKQVEPFKRVDAAIIQEIAGNLEVLEVAAGSVIIKQGDDAEWCFLLRSGVVDIILTKADGSDSRLETLDKPGSMFGETALLTNSKRNATVEASTNCKLYALSRQQFQRLTQQSQDISGSLMKLMVERLRPASLPGITVHKHEDADKQLIVTLKDASRDIYFKTNERGLFVWNLCDGEHTIMDIAIEYFQQFKVQDARVLDVESVCIIVQQMILSGFIKEPQLDMTPEKKSLPTRLFSSLHQRLQFDFQVKNTNHKITWLYDHGGFLFCNKLVLFVFGLMALYGLFVFINLIPHIGSLIKASACPWAYLIWIYLFVIILIPLRELPRALAIKAYGRESHHASIGWSWVVPKAYLDTSDMWLSSFRQRIVISLAGVYFIWVISALFAIIAMLCLQASPCLAVCFWLGALTSYVISCFLLDPASRLDGYEALISSLKLKGDSYYPAVPKQSMDENTLWLLSLLFCFVYAGIVYVITDGLEHGWVISALVLVVAVIRALVKYKWQKNRFH